MNPRQVIAAYWAGIEARDWVAVEALLAPDVEVLWPATGELLVGPENVVEVNREYPEGWSIDVRSVLADGDQVASDVVVPFSESETFAVGSFWTILDGRIHRGVEYWVTLNGDAPPTWRDAFSSRLDTDAVIAFEIGKSSEGTR